MKTKEIARLKNEYELKGWRQNVNDTMMAFLSPCGNWYHSYDLETGNYRMFSADWVNLQKERLMNGVSENK